jgi:hypothetical protein
MYKERNTFKNRDGNDLYVGLEINLFTRDFPTEILMDFLFLPYPRSPTILLTYCLKNVGRKLEVNWVLK